MKKECRELKGGERSKKLVLFLSSTNGLVDAQLDLDSTISDSEIQNVVVVNGMDARSRKSLSLHGLAGPSSKTLD